MVNLRMVHTRAETCSYWSTVYLSIRAISCAKKKVLPQKFVKKCCSRHGGAKAYPASSH